MKRVGIIGGGAVGLLLAGYLCRANYDVTVYTNTKEQSDQLKLVGLTLRSNFIDYHLPVKSEPFADLNHLSADFLFIAVKQYHLKQLVPKLLLLPGNINSIIFMQNGMGHLSELEKFREKVDNLLVAIVEHGAMKEAQTSVTHTGVGEMKIGFYQKGDFSQIIWDKLNAVDFSVAVYNSWLEIMEKKLVVNGVVNPLTAIFKVTNGELLTNPYYFQLMRKIFEEISSVFSCNDLEWQRIIEVCKKTSQNRSSMLSDIEAKRETEIEAITGYILDKAALQNKELPLNQFIYNSVKGLEYQRKEGIR